MFLPLLPYVVFIIDRLALFSGLVMMIMYVQTRICIYKFHDRMFYRLIGYVNVHMYQVTICTFIIP